MQGESVHAHAHTQNTKKKVLLFPVMELFLSYYQSISEGNFGFELTNILFACDVSASYYYEESTIKFVLGHFNVRPAMCQVLS